MNMVQASFKFLESAVCLLQNKHEHGSLAETGLM